jgi:hypothetical protein
MILKNILPELYIPKINNVIKTIQEKLKDKIAI